MGRLSREVTLAMAALAYAVELNWAVFPCRPRDKKPLVERGLLEATTSPEQIGAWWEKWPDANIGVATGEVSGIVVVDVDGPEAENALLAYGDLPTTPVSLTGRGRHLIFARTESVRNSASKLGPGLDVRGDGGYIVVAPSVHPSGGRYAWAEGLHPLKVDLASFPDRLLDALVATVAPAVVGGINPPGIASRIPSLPEIGNGTRNATMTEYAGRLFGKNMGELEVLRLLTGMNHTLCKPPLDHAELEAIVTSIGNAERRKRSVSRFEMTAPEAVAPSASLVRVDEYVLGALGEKNTQPIDAVPTMLPEWNDACRGFGGSVGLARGWHVTIGGASGTGKSLLAVNLTAAALKAGRSVLYISLEMSSEQLLSRLLAVVSRRPVRELEPGRLYSPETWNNASGRLEEVLSNSGSTLTIANRPSSEIAQLVALAKQGIDAGAVVVIFDYMQLIEARDTQGISERITRASHSVQRLAFEHNIVTVGLSQYNRATSFNKDAPPSPESLTGSSSLENDSDQVILLDHSANKRLGNRMETNVLVSKNRHGPVPSIPVVWDYTTLEVKQRAPDISDSVERRYGI